MFVVVVLSLLSAAGTPANADGRMTREAAGDYFLKTMCPVEWEVAAWDAMASEGQTLAEWHHLARHFARVLTKSTSAIMEAPAPWPTRPRVMPKLRHLVKAMMHTNDKLRAVARAGSAGAFQHAAAGAIHEGQRMRSPINALDAKFWMPYRKLDDNCTYYGYY